jgi:hypothetical protein
MKGFPRNASRIGDPHFITTRITTGRIFLLFGGLASRPQPPRNDRKVIVRFDLQSQMAETGEFDPAVIAKLTPGSSSIHLA